MRIIGVAGTFGSGKDTVADYLADNEDFVHISTGDLVREESIKRHGSIERNPYLQETATYLRRTFGGDVLIKRGLERVEHDGKQHAGVVFTGIRSLGEARGVKQLGGTLVYVDAPIEIRYERMQKRQRDKEAHVSLEQFKQNELNEQTKSDDEAEFNIYKIKDEADIVIQNDSDLETFINRAKKALKLN
ncbi:MAG: AAA family ATPase [Candidatus Saccharimonadales bacterium]